MITNYPKLCYIHIQLPTSVLIIQVNIYLCKYIFFLVFLKQPTSWLVHIIQPHRVHTHDTTILIF